MKEWESLVAVPPPNATTEKARPRAARIPGICFDASHLRVSRQHLSAVLHNFRESKPLVAKYRELKAAQASNREPNGVQS
jgi:hypothetical protein